MEVILANSTREDIENIALYANCEFNVAKEQEFTVQVARCYYTDDLTFDNWIYIPGTECGGKIECVETSTALDYVEIKGYTARGKLSAKIITPPAGQAYKSVTGDLNSIISSLIDSNYDQVMLAKKTPCGASVNNYQFERYCTVLDGLEKLCNSVGYKLVIKAIRKSGNPFFFEVSAEPVIDYSDEIELSNDNRLVFTMKSDRMGVNHLIALGKGELTDRVVIHKYMGPDGKVRNTQYYYGWQEQAYVYDYSSAESDELEKKSEEKLLELASKDTMGMDVASLNIDVNIGDIVGGKDYLTGLSNSKPIQNIIYSVTDGKISKEYKLEGESTS